MDRCDCLGRPAVAGTDRHLGVAGYSASGLNLYRAHGVAPSRASPETEFGWCRACTRCGHIRPCCPCLVVTVYLIFFLTYTPVDIDHVRGVQGRYFVVALPMAAIFLAATINVDLPRGAVATAAISGSLLSGATSFQALLGAHWSVP